MPAGIADVPSWVVSAPEALMLSSGGAGRIRPAGSTAPGTPHAGTANAASRSSGTGPERPGAQVDVAVRGLGHHRGGRKTSAEAGRQVRHACHRDLRGQDPAGAVSPVSGTSRPGPPPARALNSTRPPIARDPLHDPEPESGKRRVDVVFGRHFSQAPWGFLAAVGHRDDPPDRDRRTQRRPPMPRRRAGSMLSSQVAGTSAKLQC